MSPSPTTSPSKSSINRKRPFQKIPEPSEHEEDSESDDGIDEEGMKKLMQALGEDGLDELGIAHLRALGGSDGGGETLESDDEGGESDAMESVGVEELEGESASEERDSERPEYESGDEENDPGVALEDVESADEDVVPRQKLEIDNTIALERIRRTIQLDPSLPWTETLTISYPETIDVDVNDDLNRELAFYKQALQAADAARSLASKHKLAFTRPSDYFAEMVKSDSHMERIRQRLLDENAGMKKSDDKRKEREGKKFGKQVQLEKLKERERGKKEMEERLKGLKRKRKDILDNPQTGDDAFDIAVEDAISDRPHQAKRGRGAGGAKLPRQARDKKYGFGGAGKRSKQNTQESTDNFESVSGKRGKGSFRGGRGAGRGGARGGRGGSAKRLGKDRRMAARSKA